MAQTIIGYATHRTAPMLISSTTDHVPTIAPIALPHPLLCPEALEPQRDDFELANKRKRSVLSSNNDQQVKNSVVYVKNQPRFISLEWVEIDERTNKNRTLVSFLGEIASMFLPKDALTLTSDNCKNEDIKKRSSNAPLVPLVISSDSNQQQSSGSSPAPLKPQEALHPLSPQSLTALCSAMLCDRPITLKTLWQRIHDGINNRKEGKNAFKGLLEDLAAHADSATTTSADAKAKATAVSKVGIGKILQWVLFLSNPAGHITPLDFIDESATKKYETTSVTPNQLKEKAFELQLRFYSLVDEKWFLACHLPASVSSSSATALSNIQNIALKALTNLAKVNESAVAGAGTSVHGLLPSLPQSTEAGNNSETSLAKVISLLKKSQSAITTLEKDESDNANLEQDDDDFSDVGSLVSGVSGSVVGGAVGRRPMTLKSFRNQYGSRASNELKFRTVSLLSAINFGKVVNFLVKYVTLETLHELKEFVRGGCLTDANGGMASLFSSTGRQSTAGSDKGGNSSGRAGNMRDGANERNPNLILDLAWLSTILQSTELMSELISTGPAGKPSSALFADLAQRLKSTSGRLPAMIAADNEQSKLDVNSQQYDLGESEYAFSQRPIISLLLHLITAQLDDRQARSDSFEANGISDNDDGTASQASKKQSASLNLMVIQRSKGATPASVVGGGAVKEQTDVTEISRRIEVLKKRLSDMFAANVHDTFSTVERVSELAWTTVPQHDPTSTLETPTASVNTKRAREETTATPLSVSQHSDMAPPSPIHRPEAAISLKLQQATLHRNSVLSLVELPIKIKFDWAPFYPNPSEASNATKSTVAKPLWVRSSQREQHILDKIALFVRQNNLSFNYFSLVAEATAGARPTPLPKVEAAGKMDISLVPFQSKANQDKKVQLEELLEAMAGNDELKSQNDNALTNTFSALLTNSIVMRRVPTQSAKSAKPTTPPMGIVNWILDQNDSVLVRKFGEAMNGVSDEADVFSLLGDTKKNLEIISTATGVLNNVNEHRAFLATKNAEIDSLDSLQRELQAFSETSHALLEHFESHMMEINEYFQTQLGTNTSAGNYEDWLASLPIINVHNSTANAAIPEEALPIVDLDQGAQAKPHLYLHPTPTIWLQHSGLSTAAYLELLSFLHSHVKRSHRLRALHKLSEVTVSAVQAHIQATKEEMWLVGV